MYTMLIVCQKEFELIYFSKIGLVFADRLAGSLCLRHTNFHFKIHLTSTRNSSGTTVPPSGQPRIGSNFELQPLAPRRWRLSRSIQLRLSLPLTSTAHRKSQEDSRLSGRNPLIDRLPVKTRTPTATASDRHHATESQPISTHVLHSPFIPEIGVDAIRQAKRDYLGRYYSWRSVHVSGVAGKIFELPALGCTYSGLLIDLHDSITSEAGQLSGVLVSVCSCVLCPIRSPWLLQLNKNELPIPATSKAALCKRYIGGSREENHSLDLA